MLHEALAAYLDRVEQAVLQCNNAYTERYTEEILAPDRVNLRIRLRFDQEHLLEINEAIVVIENNPTSLDYRYHCQDKQNRLIFRYDNTPHFPNLPSFPYHKHSPDEVVACEKPDPEQVLQNAMKIDRISYGVCIASCIGQSLKALHSRFGCPKQGKVVVLPFTTLKGCQNLFWQRGANSNLKCIIV